MLPTFRSAVRLRLRRWYQKSKRDLPWRRTSDPYAVWIAEMMLQQTQVNTVIPYYERFLRAFPTVELLARAPLQRVLRHWSGLGYYRRAVNLSRAARQIARRHGGKMPDGYEPLRALPGVGDYTAGAVLSIAFGQRYPAIDGNVRRVLGRLMKVESERDLRIITAALVPKSEPGEFNQALMELGATLCTPKNQRCRDCPLDALCASGSRAGAMGARTTSKKQIVLEDMIWPLALVRHGSKILLHRRTGPGLLSGLWDLPGGQLSANRTEATALQPYFSALKIRPAQRSKIGEIRHAMTRWRIRAPVYLFDLDRKTAIDLPGARWRWISPSRIEEQATSAMTTKAVALFLRHEEASR